VSGSAANTHGFTGREADSGGLDYLRFRYYSPGLGRFMSQDPLGYPGGPSPNLYAYAGDDPVDALDPFGLNPWVKFFADVLFMVLVTVVTDGLADVFLAGELFGAEEEGLFARLLFEERGGAVFGPEEEAALDATPGGRVYTAHYLEETGPVRNIPGSVVDQAIDHGQVVEQLADRTIYYDPVNDVTVVQSKTTGRIMSVRRGRP